MLNIFRRRRQPERLYTLDELNRVVHGMMVGHMDAVHRAVRDVAPDKYDEFAAQLDWHFHQAGAHLRAKGGRE